MNTPPIEWTCHHAADLTVAAFTITAAGGLLAPETLDAVTLPDELAGRETLGVVFSGRGPVWLYGVLVGLAHPFAWIGLHDPRLGGAVVVGRHVAAAPPLGALVPLPG